MKKVRLSLLAALLIIPFTQALSQSMAYEWGINFGDSGSDDESVHEVFVDENGSSYIVGIFEGTVDFDPGPGTTEITSAGLNDGYILKLDVNGEFVWAKTFESSNQLYLLSVIVDTDGNVYACGGFTATGDFDPGPDVYELVGGGMFILKLDENGDFVWVKHLEGNSYSYAYRLGFHESHIIMSGNFQGTVDFDPNVGTYMASSGGSNDVYIMSLDFDGNFEWMVQFGGSSQDVMQDMSVATDGRIALTGHFRNTADFDPGPGEHNITSASVGVEDIFIVSLNHLGEFEWAHGFGTDEYDSGRGVDFDSDGNVYATGLFEGTSDFDPGAGTHMLIEYGDWDIYVLKLSASGDFDWAHSFGEEHNDFGFDIVVGTDDHVYITGNYRGLVDWDPGLGTMMEESISIDLFLLKLDELGNYSSFVGLTGTISQYGHALYSDKYNGIWVAGTMWNEVDLEGEIVEEEILSASGNEDVCLLYFTQCDIDNTVEQTGYTLTANEPLGIYQWYDCDTEMIIPGENDNSYTATENGNYAVIISQFACVDTSSCYAIEGLSVEENEVFKLTVYPNPAHDIINYTLPNDEKAMSITIIDIKGAIVTRANPSNQISVSDLESGTYTLIIETENNSYRGLFIK